ncbi:MAG TPA: hypothetical protein VD862_03430, partial [Candidatus Paceibacterota bacterium]|nr:hypothetical protein [Candidatus Paceibacterota bacterium]
LRVGTAITFLWIAVLIFRSPEAWGGLLQPWAAGLLPVPLKEAMYATAVLDIIVGLALLVDVATLAAAAIGLAHVGLVIVVVGITPGTVRDIAIFAGLAALIFDAWPRKSPSPENSKHE